MPARAHPHIWVDVRTEILFDAQGRVNGIRHFWTFDPAFSAWSIQGLDTNGDGTVSRDEMQELADLNTESLAEFDYYTFAGEGDRQMRLSAAEAYMTHEQGRTRQVITLTPDAPFAIQRELDLEVTDPEYYVAFSFLDENAATLVGAPAGCSVTAHPPGEIEIGAAQRLSEIGPDTFEIPEDLREAVRAASNLAVIACAGGPAATAADAAADMARPRTSPFAAPPAEPGLPLPSTGFLGWVSAQQAQFYQTLTTALGELTRDGRAFWTLGLLSFLYGVFHAAGPGHGKVVITSYALATEAELRRGVALSFAAAALQSLTAIALVVPAAALFNLTGAAIGGLTAGISLASYLLITALGAWLVLRRLFGWGHAHGHLRPALQPAGGHHDHHEHHDDHAHHDHAHASDHHHDHHHAIAPPQTRGGWREMSAVVLAVGLRPCTGALIVLVFALAQNVLLAGVVAVLLMGLGTGITIAALASLAVGAKGLVHRLDGTGGTLGGRIVWGLELLGALAVFAFGLVLVLASL